MGLQDLGVMLNEGLAKPSATEKGSYILEETKK